MAHYPAPHTKQWFIALRKSDPRQAAETAEHIRVAESADVCSLCGDEPASDFQIIRGQFLDGGIATIRLCLRCRTARQTPLGDNFVPMAGGAGVGAKN